MCIKRLIDLTTRENSRWNGQKVAYRCLIEV